MSEEHRSYHEVANIFPLLQGEEFEHLKADIKANGLLDPIILYHDGSIIDGRNRHRACIETGTQPRFEQWSGNGDFSELVTFVVSKNLHRRHLNSGQQAAIAVDATEIVERLEREARERQAQQALLNSPFVSNVETIPPLSEADTGKTRDKLADLFNTNPRYVSDAKKLRDEAPDLLAQVRDGEVTLPQAKRELKERGREAVREQNRELVETTPPATAQTDLRYQTIVLDPPWDWGDEGDADQFGRARPVYDTMPFADVLALPIPDLADTNAHIYLWITNRSLPKGFQLLEAWGFRYITALTWCKPHFGMGNYFRGSTEHVLFGVRGSLQLLRKDAGTWFEAKRPGRHSAKPDEFYELVQTCSPGPWLELFARQQRPGWHVWGAEA
jgi:N6-adenosine-specific RNA methylase IME4